MMMIRPVKLIWVPDGAAKRFKSSLTVSAYDQSNIKNYSLKIQMCLNILFDFNSILTKWRRLRHHPV